MKSWQLISLGHENIRLVDQPAPEPGPEEVLVRIKAVSLNFRDWDIVVGTYHAQMPLPLTLASDAAGEVAAIGKSVTRWKVGDRVTGIFRPLWLDGELTKETAASLGGPLPGVLSEYVKFSEQSLVRTPDYMTDAEASTLPIAGVTAWVAIAEEGKLQPRETVVLQGTGGVSLFGLQIAKAFGAQTIVTTGKEEKLQWLKELGTDLGIHTGHHADWDQAALQFTGGKGVDHVLEIAGGNNLQKSIKALRIGGHIVIIGYLEDRQSTLPLAPIITKRIRIQGISVGHRSAFERMTEFFSKHQIHPVIDKTYSFTEVPAAYRHLQRGAFGKIVIQL